MAPKRKCSFNDELKRKHPFLFTTSSDSDLECRTCKGKFSIAYRGAADIAKHLETKQHRDAVNAAVGAKPLTSFFSSASSEDHHIAACEGTWAYHTIKENQSFRSCDCATKIFRSCFHMLKFTCSHTKCAAIVTNVLAPYALETLKSDLNETRFVSLLTDGSNHGNIKMMPVLVRFFKPTIGLKVKILNFTSQKGETSAIITELLNSTVEAWNLKNKFVCFSADNTNTNFGGQSRGGQNNVFARLRAVNPNMMGIGCAAHVVHNGLKFACDQMPFDVESVVVKTFSHFYIYNVRTATLMDFCESAEEEYRNLQGYTKTRFLALGPAINSILRIYGGLSSYFNENRGKSARQLDTFYENRLSKLWLLFLADVIKLFESSVRKIEGDHVSAIDVVAELDELMEQLLLRKETNFLTPATTAEKNAIERDGHCTAIVLPTFKEFLGNCYSFLCNAFSTQIHVDKYMCSAQQVPTNFFCILPYRQSTHIFNPMDCTIQRSQSIQMGGIENNAGMVGC